MHAFIAGFVVFVFGGAFATFFGVAFAIPFGTPRFEFFIDFIASLTVRCNDRWDLVQIGSSSNTAANASSFAADSFVPSGEAAFVISLSVNASTCLA
jgi:hypothetical protein